MGSPPPPGKSRAAVHKRAIPPRRYGPAHIFAGFLMTLQPSLMPTVARTLSRPTAVFVVLVALAGVLAGCGEGQRQQTAPPPPKVTVAKPTLRTIVDQDEYVGRFVAVDVVEVRARVSGYLDKVHFTDG